MISISVASQAEVKMLVVWVAVWAAAASALPYQEMDPSQVLLHDLSTDEVSHHMSAAGVYVWHRHQISIQCLQHLDNGICT